MSASCPHSPFGCDACRPPDRPHVVMGENRRTVEMLQDMLHASTVETRSLHQEIGRLKSENERLREQLRDAKRKRRRRAT